MITAKVLRGKNVGLTLTPHVHEDGCHVVSPTRFETDYVRLPASEPLAPHLARGLSLRMSGTGHPPGLISPASIAGWR